MRRALPAAPTRPRTGSSRGGPLSPPSKSGKLRRIFLHYFVFFAFGLSGAAALIYEVVWTRKLSTIMGSSTYALSTMLAAFMLGLALGGLVGGLLVPRLKRHLRAFAICEIAIGLSALATIPLITAATPVFLKAYFLFHSSFRAFAIAQFGVVFTIMLIPTTLMGITFPLVIRHYAGGSSETARRAGFLYAFNTFGAVIGSTAAGFFLIPRLGGGDATLMAALLNIGGGLVILLVLEKGPRRFALVPVLLVGAAVLRLTHTPAAPFVSTYSALRFGDYDAVSEIRESIQRSGPESFVVFHHEGVESDVHLMREDPSKEWILSNNGKLEGGASSVGFVLLAQLPYFSRERDESEIEALNIGLGSGITLSHLAELPVQRIDSVEISEGILEANRRFMSPQLFSDPRIEHVLADGRNYLLVNDGNRYDIIVVSPSWAVELASAGLLTDEFFALSSKRLAPDGTIAIWLDLFYAPDEDIEVVFRTLRRSFPHATAWVTEDGEMVLIGSPAPFGLGEQEIAERVVAHTPDMAGRFGVARSSADSAGLSDGPVNTDDHPILEFRNARNLLTGLDPSE
jgi:spermidine synthase